MVWCSRSRPARRLPALALMTLLIACSAQPVEPAQSEIPPAAKGAARLASPPGASTAPSVPPSRQPAPSARDAGSPRIGTAVGQLAPDVAIRSADGSDISLADLRGRPVWLYFWAAGCGPCEFEMPHMQTLYEAHRSDDLVIVGVGVGMGQSDIAAFALSRSITFPLGQDPEAMVAYGVTTIPSHFWIDRDGIVRARLIGPGSPEDLDQALSSILPSGSTP